MKKFLTKVNRKSVEAIEFDDLIRITSYQTELVNTMLYELDYKTPTANQQKQRNRIMAEIRLVEAWLKRGFFEFANDNNRKQLA